MADSQGTTYTLASTDNSASSTTSSGSTPRVLGRQISSGNIRGNQNITGTLTIVSPTNNSPVMTLSGTNQTISIITSPATSTSSMTGTLTFGLNTDSSYGMQVTDNSGFVLFELNGTTWKWYDKTTGNNVMQIGLLPDGTYGMAVAKKGYNVSSLYS